MNTQVIITLCIMAFMVVMLLTRLLLYGITGMICCTAFVLFGIADIPTAFSGFSNSTTLMVVGMIVVATQLSKTSIVRRLRGFMEKMQGKGTMVVMLTYFVVTIILSQLMGQVACISIMMIFLQTLDEDSDLAPAPMLFAVATLNTMWTSKIPFAMGATMPGTINSFFEGVAPDYAIGMGDYFRASLVPGVLGLIYCLVFYKLIPKSHFKKENVKGVKEVAELKPAQEMIVFAVFIAIMAAFFLSKVVPKNIQNILPIAGVLIFLITGVTTVAEVTPVLTGDIIFLIAGMSAVSTMLGKTGVGELIGQGVLKLLGGHPAPILVITVFCLVTSVMTNFLSNMGTMALMIPIAASTALAGGFNVQTVVVVTAVSAWMAYVLPTGCAGTMLGFGTGNYSVGQTIKFTLPLYILQVVSLIVSASLLFPIYD
jgi:sodium-dependent dicarboxylate transporter 2/3/5